MSIRIVRVVVPSPLYGEFDYQVPTDWSLPVVGARVRVPFGTRQLIAIVVAHPAQAAVEEQRLRPLLEILDSHALLSEELLRLAAWVQRYYHQPPGEVYSTLLPTLLRQGVAAQLPLREVRYYRLSTAGVAQQQTGMSKRAPRQQQVLDYLYGQAFTAETQLVQQCGAQRPLLRQLCERGWLECELRSEPDYSVTAVDSTSCTAPALNHEQLSAVQQVQARWGQGFQPFLLQGITGSGKTEVYLQLTAYALQKNQQVLLLVPEIGLTPQLLARFASRFAVPQVALHSGLTDKQRLVNWLLARDGHARIVIGTRSAVFTPLPALGLMVLDEEHDPSFKQQDGIRYHARDVALVRAQRLGISIVLGSATPALESLYNAQRQRYQLLTLHQRAGGARAPQLHLLDIRRQPLKGGLAPALLQAMSEQLADPHAQVLLFLNRRGFAPTLLCHECGWVGQCAHCDARLTWHKHRQRLQCHHCGYQQAVPATCPDCGSIDLRALGHGTECLEQVLTEQFPGVGLARIDRDSTQRQGSLEQLLDEIRQGQRRILLGTQMLAKGHDFPEVSLVGVIDADQALFAADFRAEERLAQQLLQVAGRAGRAQRAGVVLIQTHHPDHPLLQQLLQHGYSGFAQAALEQRQMAGLPPFSYQALLRAEAPHTQTVMQFLQSALQCGKNLTIGEVEWLGPVSAPMERLAGLYRGQLLLQATERQYLQRTLSVWVGRLGELAKVKYLRWSLDVDPVLLS